MPMMAMTTSNSMSVNPFLREWVHPASLWPDLIKIDWWHHIGSSGTSAFAVPPFIVYVRQNQKQDKKQLGIDSIRHFSYFRRLEKNSRLEIPRKAVYRLSVYFHGLQRLKSNGIQTVSSEALAKAAGVKPTQLRKDLTYFGQFGTRGLGYDVEQLSKMISDLLGTTRLQPVVLVGVGNLGLALISYRGFAREGFEIVGAFDMDTTRKRGKTLPLPIEGMDKLAGVIARHGVKMAILTVPASAAQEVANSLMQMGITGILNFAPIVLDAPGEVTVNNVNLAIELENLSYFVQR
jgi:redox-sensing transcriptional repressor